MSLPLHDLGKLRVTHEADAWLTVKARGSGKDKLEIVRDLIQAATLRDIEDAKLLLQLAQVQRTSRDE